MQLSRDWNKGCPKIVILCFDQILATKNQNKMRQVSAETDSTEIFSKRYQNCWNPYYNSIINSIKVWFDTIIAPRHQPPKPPWKTQGLSSQNVRCGFWIYWQQLKNNINNLNLIYNMTCLLAKFFRWHCYHFALTWLKHKQIFFGIPCRFRVKSWSNKTRTTTVE